MKFMVLCMLDPASVSGSHDLVDRGLAQAGFSRVGSSRSAGGLCFGIENAFVGEFRAHDSKALQARLRKHIDACLPGRAPAFRLVSTVLDASPAARKRA